MKLLAALVIALAAAVGLTRIVQQDPGHVLVSYGGYTVEGTLAVFVAALAVAFLVAYLVTRLIAYLSGTPRRIRQWRIKRAGEQAHRGLVQGLILMAEGKWGQAEGRLTEHADSAETPLLNYLAAARAAQLQRAYDRRDLYLKEAARSMPGAWLAVGLTQAELQYDHGQMEQALATLNVLSDEVPRHPQALKLLALTHESLGNWPELGNLVDRLRRLRVLEPANQQRLERTLHRHQLVAPDNAEDLQQIWDSLPSRSRNDILLLETYVRRLMETGAHETAEKLIRRTLDRQWNDDLCEIYGQLQHDDASSRLSHAEKWLETRPDDARLLLTLGRLALQAKLWGIARRFIDASIEMAPSATAYRELGALLESLDDKGAALDCYRTGLYEGTGAPASRLRLKREPLAELAGHHGKAPA